MATEILRDPWLQPRITDIYVRVLKRTPDAAGRAYWTTAIRGGSWDLERMYSHLAVTDQAFFPGQAASRGAWIDALYRDLLGHGAPAAALAYWEGVLDAGGTRAQVVRGILRSPERARTLVRAAYHRYLQRAVDSAALTAWVGAYRLGTLDEQGLVARLLGGAEARNAGCDPFDTRSCLLPFPNDLFTVPDPTTATGRRVAFKPEWMPANKDGVRINPSEWNRNDGFSVGQAATVRVPGIDLAQTGATRVNDVGTYDDPDAPIIILDLDTGDRVPMWAELDKNIPLADRATDQVLYVRPAVQYTPGHRYAVVLRNLKNAAGTTLTAPASFRTYRDDLATTNDRVQARRAHMESLFGDLTDAGIDQADLYLTWDFTVASTENTTGRLRHIRDDAIDSLGGAAPDFTVTSVTDAPATGVARRVEGTYEVPLYLTGDGSPGNAYKTDANGVPIRNGSYTAAFDCEIPDTAATTPARPTIYGHGLFGDLGEVRSGPQRSMVAEHNMVYCATNWIGMSETDIANAGKILQDASSFKTLADRSQQGILNTIILGRLLVTADGFVSDPAFQNGSGDPLIDTAHLFYDGNSQGAVIGGAFVAMSNEVEAGVLGVAGMNYSTLLERSKDFDPFNAIYRLTYLDPVERVVGLGLFQMLWDRGETNGYARYATTSPLPGTRTHRILIHTAVGDQQVSYITAEIEARTMGAAVHRPAYAPGRTLDVDPVWGVPTLSYPSSGSGLVIWDSGAALAPLSNTPPRVGPDSHEDPRRSPLAQEQKSTFLQSGGTIVNVCGADPCTAPAT